MIIKREKENKIKVYVAGKFRDGNLPNYIEDINQTPGFEVTWNWSLYRELGKSMAAEKDIDGVKKSKVFIAVMDHLKYPYKGTFTELGCALCDENKKIIIVTGNINLENEESYSEASKNCFFWHPYIIHISNFNKSIKIIKSIYYPRNRKILILGYGRHGKDSVADIIKEKTKLKHISSSMMANKLVVYDKLKTRYNYKTEEECFEDRANHREEWYQLICEYNKEDKSKLTKEILKEHDMYVGLRDKIEFDHVKDLFDFILWVDASKRCSNLPFDSTLKIGKEYADIIIDNNGTMNQLIDKTIRLLKFLDLM